MQTLLSLTNWSGIKTYSREGKSERCNMYITTDLKDLNVIARRRWWGYRRTVEVILAREFHFKSYFGPEKWISTRESRFVLFNFPISFCVCVCIGGAWRSYILSHNYCYKEKDWIIMDEMKNDMQISNPKHHLNSTWRVTIIKVSSNTMIYAVQ